MSNPFIAYFFLDIDDCICISNSSGVDSIISRINRRLGKRENTDLLRKKIIDMSYTEWKKMGFSKGTLHYMKQNARSEKPFTLNAHVRERVEMWEEC